MRNAPLNGFWIKNTFPRAAHAKCVISIILLMEPTSSDVGIVQDAECLIDRSLCR